MKSLMCFFSLLLINNSYSQASVAVYYETQTLLTKDKLNGLPESLKDEMIKQVSEAKKESVMYIQGNEIFYAVVAKDFVKNENLLKNKKEENKGPSIINSSLEVKFQGSKLIKNNIKNNYVTRENGKLITNKLPKVIWKYTNRTKKVAGYNCFEAITTFKKHKLSVFFTKELWSKASPDKLPFLDGVILEYNYSHFYVKAIEIKQYIPFITNFL